YPVEVTDYEEKEADTDKSTNCIFPFKVIDGKGKGTSFNKLFNEKALGFGKNLWKALDLPQDVEVPGQEGKGYRLSTEVFRQQVGKKLKVYEERKEQQGK